MRSKELLDDETIKPDLRNTSAGKRMIALGSFSTI